MKTLKTFSVLIADEKYTSKIDMIEKQLPVKKETIKYFLNVSRNEQI